MAEKAAENLKATGAAAGELREELTSLKGSVVSVTGQIGLFTAAWEVAKGVLPFDEIRKTEDALARMGRGLAMGRAELESNARAVKELSHQTKIFSQDAIAGTISQLRLMSPVLAANLTDVRKLTELGFKAGGTEGLKFAQAMGQIVSTIPSARMQMELLTKNSQAFSHTSAGMLEVLRRFGVEGLGVYTKMQMAALGIDDASAKLEVFGNISEGFRTKFTEAMLGSASGLRDLLKLLGPELQKGIGNLAGLAAAMGGAYLLAKQIPSAWASVFPRGKIGKQQELMAEYESIQKASDRADRDAARRAEMGITEGGRGRREISTATFTVQTATINVAAGTSGVATTATGAAVTTGRQAEVKAIDDTVRLRKAELVELETWRRRRSMGTRGFGIGLGLGVAGAGMEMAGMQTAGGILQGAGMGAVVGSQIMPGWGTAIGAGVGGLMSALPTIIKQFQGMSEEEKAARLEDQSRGRSLAAGRRVVSSGGTYIAGQVASAEQAYLEAASKREKQERDAAEYDKKLRSAQKEARSALEKMDIGGSLTEWEQESAVSRMNLRAGSRTGLGKGAALAPGLATAVGTPLYDWEKELDKQTAANKKAQEDLIKGDQERTLKLQALVDYRKTHIVELETEQRISENIYRQDVLRGNVGANLGVSQEKIAKSLREQRREVAAQLAAYEKLDKVSRQQPDVIQAVAELRDKDATLMEQEIVNTNKQNTTQQKLLSYSQQIADAEEQRAASLHDPMLQQEARMRSMQLGSRDVQLKQQAITNLRAQGIGENSEPMMQAKASLAQSQSALAQKFDVARRTWEDIFTEQVIGMPTGTYMQPMGPSGFEALGPAFMTGQAPGAPTRGKGTHLARTQELFGMGGTGQNEMSQVISTITDIWQGGVLLRFDSESQGMIRTWMETAAGAGNR